MVAEKSKEAFGTWKKMIDEQLQKIETAGEEFERYGRIAADQATQAIDEISKLLKEQLEHTFQLAHQWRKLSTDSIQRTVDVFNSAVSSRQQ